MPTDVLTIKLTGRDKEFVEARADADGVASAEEYVLQLVREDRQRRLTALEDRLIDALQGEAVSVSDADLESDE